MAWHRPLSHWHSAFLAGQGPWLWLVQTVAIIAWWHALRHVTWPGATADITPAQSRDWRQTASQPERDDANYAATRITTSHDIHNSGNQSSGFRSPINNISVWLHSLWTSRCLRDRNTLIAQPRLPCWELSMRTLTLSCITSWRDPGVRGLGDVFTEVDSSLIDLVPIPGRDGAECWHDNYQHRLITAAPALEPHLPAQSQLRSVQIVFIKNSEIWTEGSQDRWHDPEWIMSKESARKIPLPLQLWHELPWPHSQSSVLLCRYCSIFRNKEPGCFLI